MYKKLLCFIVLINLLMCSSCVYQNKPNSTSDEITNDKALDSFFQQLHKEKMFNGAVAVKKNGKLILKKGYGKANFHSDQDFDPDTPMEIASVSKQFTAAAILILEQEGKLDTDDKAQKYLGENFPYPEITIKELLTHTSGLPNYASYFREHWDSTEIAYNKDILTYFKKENPELENRPGAKYSYSNSGYIILAEIVTAISGQPLDEFLRDNIFQPANMKSSAFYERDTIWKMKDYAPGYMMDLKTCKYTKPENLPGKYYYFFLSGRLGSGRLSSSINDLIKWDSLLYGDKILSKKSKEKSFQVHRPEKDTSDYGFGWHIYENDSLGKVVYHTGSWAGNLSLIKRFIDDKSLIIILDNTYNSAYMKDVRNQVEGYLEGGPLKTPKQKLDALLKKEICDLNQDNIYSWYKDISNEVTVDIEDIQELEKDYRKVDEIEKADLVKNLVTFIRKKE